MKGTDLTPEQIESAEEFVRDRCKNPAMQAAGSEQKITCTVRELAQMIAWYGAMRYEAGAAGINSLEDPGLLETKRANLRVVKSRSEP